MIHRGTVLGVVPKAYLPNYREFYEHRHFAPGIGVTGGGIEVAGRRVPFGIDPSVPYGVGQWNNQVPFGSGSSSYSGGAY